MTKQHSYFEKFSIEDKDNLWKSISSAINGLEVVEQLLKKYKGKWNKEHLELMNDILNGLTQFSQEFIGTYVPEVLKDEVLDKFAESIVSMLEREFVEFKQQANKNEYTRKQYVDAARILFDESSKSRWWTQNLSPKGILAKLELKCQSLRSVPLGKTT